MPSIEYLTSEFGDAAQASDMPCLRFLRTRLARPVAVSVVAVMWQSYSVLYFSASLNGYEAMRTLILALAPARLS